MISDMTESKLRKDYYQLGLTQKEISEKYGCSRRTVSRRMREYGIEKLPKLSVREKNNGRTYYISDGDKVAEYQLVAIANGAKPEKVFGGSHIHHLNGCKYDNRPDNLVVLTPEEHGLVEQDELKVDKDKGILYKNIESL